MRDLSIKVARMSERHFLRQSQEALPGSPSRSKLWAGQPSWPSFAHQWRAKSAPQLHAKRDAKQAGRQAVLVLGSEHERMSEALREASGGTILDIERLLEHAQQHQGTRGSQQFIAALSGVEEGLPRAESANRFLSKCMLQMAIGDPSDDRRRPFILNGYPRQSKLVQQLEERVGPLALVVQVGPPSSADAAVARHLRQRAGGEPAVAIVADVSDDAVSSVVKRMREEGVF